MKFAPVLLFIAATSLFLGCTHMKIASEYEPGYDFGDIQTYKWVDAPSEILEELDTYLNDDLQQALNDGLTQQGWKQVMETNNATVQVSYYIKIKSHEEYTEETQRKESEFAGGFVYKTDNRTWDYEERKPDQIVYTVETGDLTLLISDVATSNCVWRGTLETRIDRSQTPEKQMKLFRKITRKLMKQMSADTP